MRKVFFAMIAVALLLLIATRPAKPADLNGRLLDGHPFFAMISSASTSEYGFVVFRFDEANVRLLDGRTFTIVLNDESLSDIHYVAGHTLDRHFWRIDLAESPYFYGANIIVPRVPRR